MVNYVPNRKGCSTYQWKRKGCKDLISSLTNDILVDILSLLDLREAVRTCALSKRWRYVSAYLFNLNFDGSATLLELYNNNYYYPDLYATRLESEAHKFVHYVNQVVSSSLAPDINRFRVCFQLGDIYHHDVITWLNFAMGKSVKELEVDLSTWMATCPNFPIYLNSFSLSVHSLVSLSLGGVAIDGPFLESVLLNFPNLERLKMKHLRCRYSTLKVVGDLLKLRYLEISFCEDLGKLEISARNLISIVYRGFQNDVKFSYVPLLDEASFAGDYSRHMIHNVHHPGFGFLSQLTELTLTVSYTDDIIQYSVGIPQFRNLKQLDLTLSDCADQSLLVLTDWIDACPVLHKFKLKRFFINRIYRLNTKVSGGNVIKGAEKYHHCLNIFEMVGFRGAKPDIELVLYLARFAIVLEKVIFDPHGPSDEGKPNEDNTLEQIEATRKQAKLLQNQLPARVQMEVR